MDVGGKWRAEGDGTVDSITIPMLNDSRIPGRDDEELVLNGPVLSTVRYVVHQTGLELSDRASFGSNR